MRMENYPKLGVISHPKRQILGHCTSVVDVNGMMKVGPVSVEPEFETFQGTQAANTVLLDRKVGARVCCATRSVRGVFKKFAAQPRRKTNFTTKRGVRDVTLLKRPLTQPPANRSSCFAQAVGCCKNV